MKQMTQVAVEREIATRCNVTGDGQADHVVSGGRDPGDQLPPDAALEDAL